MPDEELLRLIIDSARDYAIFSMDPDGLVTSWNAGAERLLGWTTDEILHTSADVIFTPEDRALGAPERERIEAAATGRANDDRWQQRKNGERFWASGLMMVLSDRKQGFVKILRDRTEKHFADDQLRKSVERQRVLMAELQHRTRNLLGIAQAIAIQTLRRCASPGDFERDFTRRMNALGRVQGLISGEDYGPIDLQDLISSELAAYQNTPGSVDRVRVEGPLVRLTRTAAQAVGLALHELTTNAVKYGALSSNGGRLAISWGLEQRGDTPWLVLEWRENGVALPANADSKAGYGRELIEKALPYQLEAETRFEFGNDGIRCWIAVPLDQTASTGS